MRRLAVLAMVVMAGCLSPVAPGGETTAPWASERDVYLRSTMTLADAPEDEARSVAMRPFFQAWAAGDDYPTWLLDPTGRDALVTSLHVTLFLRVTGPVLTSARFPDVMVYAGSDDAWMGYGELRAMSAFTPGEVYEIGFEIALPRGGLWLAPDGRLGLKVVPVMTQQEQANVEVLLGPETPSGARLRIEPLEVARGSEVSGDGGGQVVGTMYAQQAAPPTTRHATPIDLPPGASYLVAWMNTTESVGVPDLDLSLVDADGKDVAGSGTPTPREAIRVPAAALAGEDASLVVTTAGAPRATFRLEWRIGLA